MLQYQLVCGLSDLIVGCEKSFNFYEVDDDYGFR